MRRPTFPTDALPFRHSTDTTIQLYEIRIDFPTSNSAMTPDEHYQLDEMRIHFPTSNSTTPDEHYQLDVQRPTVR